MNAFLVRLSVVFAWLFVFGQGAFAAVTFTVAPSAVSNTYAGSITLQIGGLTNTETVVIQKFLDLNTNGVLDGNDWLVQQFTLQDGANFVIGGVTNFNVPGDLNPATGAITAALNFQNGDFVQNIIGKYLYKLSSPVGHFAPLTNSFSVTNFPFLQQFTGNVVSNGTSTTVSNAVVLLFPPRVRDKTGLEAIRWRASWRTMRAAIPSRCRRERICRWLSGAIMLSIPPLRRCSRWPPARPSPPI
jgi:hypothetical protein